MADRPQRKIAGHSDIASDDPFAELTRIMGFDPREPVEQRVEPRLVPVGEIADDFDIDLEKELMGEFGAFGVEDEAPQAPQAAANRAAAPEAAPEPAPEPAMSDWHAVEPEGAPEPAREPSHADMDEHIAAALEEDFRFDDDFSTADAPVEQEFAAAPEIEAAKTPEHFDGDFDAHFDQVMADVDMDFTARPAEPLEEAPFVAPEAVAEPVAPAVEPMHAVAATAPDSLEDELNALLNRMSVHPAAPDLAGDAWAPQPVAAAPSVDDEPATADEMNWALDAEPVQADVEAAPVAERDIHAELLADLEASGFEDEKLAASELPAPEYPVAEAAEEVAPEHEVHFDSEAFDAAMAGEFDLGDEAASPSALPVQEEDPVESLKWLASRPVPAPEPVRAWGRGNPVAPMPPVEQVERPEPEEPFVSQSYDAPQLYQDAAPADYEPEYEPEPELFEDEAFAAAPAATGEGVPDIETIDVPERVVALADDLDLPELAFEEDQAETPAYDDLDAEFASLLHEMNVAEPAALAARATAYDDESYSGGFGNQHVDQRAYADFSQAAAPVAAVAATAAYAGIGGFQHPGADNAAGDGKAADSDLFAVTDDFDYDPDQDESMAASSLAEQGGVRQSRGRGLMVAGIIGAVAVVGGLGAFALSFGDKGSTGAPAIVKADNQPIKVKPENPGGTVVPNQDNKVYDMVAKGPKPAAPAQQNLVTQTEEPVDVTAQEPPSRVVDLTGQDQNAAAPEVSPPATTAKAEDRVEQTAQDSVGNTAAETPVVTPRKVRTMVVKPDGSLVAREDPAPAAEPTDPAPQHVAASAQPEATGTVAAALADGSADAQVAAAPAIKPAAKVQSSNTPAVAPIAPQRPSDQPVNVVGEVKPDQVASIDPGAAAAGSWSVQIASQPTAESAQSTYQDLSRRYAGVLAGHTASIVKAEVAGKGTFYRVRVPAGSRNDAIALCTNYKAAGGNCFVSK